MPPHGAFCIRWCGLARMASTRPLDAKPTGRDIAGVATTTRQRTGPLAGGQHRAQALAAVRSLICPSRGYSMPLTSSWDEQLGQPIVSNGLPLTKIHHAAFDAHLIGIDPDYRIHVSARLLEIQNGPFLV